MLRLLVVTLLLTSCSYFKRDNKPEESATSEALRVKKEFYCNEGKRILAERGFMDDRCDSLLFTSLWSSACGPIDISSYEGEPGKWYRNPARDCFINGVPNGSASTISRDMFLGLFHHLWSTKDSQNVKEIVEYGQANNWIMGEAKDNETLISRCLMTPQLISIAKDMNGALSRLTQPEQNSDDAVGVNTGFRAHLDVLRVLLSGRVRGAISDVELKTLKDQAERQPQNALYVAAYDKYAGGSKAIGLLLDEKHFPGDRLPTSADHCQNYLYSRDQDDGNGQENPDWLPCPEENKEHDGTDFVFAAWVILDGR